MEEREKTKLVSGVWTPWAQVLCHACHGNEGPRNLDEEHWQAVLKPRDLQPGNAQTFCDSCGADVQVSRGLAAEHNLVRELREQGIDAVMEQTGGMMSACSIEVAPELRQGNGEGDPGLLEVLVTSNDMGQGEYNIGVYDNDLSMPEVPWGQVTIPDLDGVRDWVNQNRDKLATIDAPEKDRPLDDLMREAKEKAAEKTREFAERKTILAKDPTDIER